jgi:hypothetical protein
MGKISNFIKIFLYGEDSIKKESNVKTQDSINDKSDNKDEIKITWSPTSERLMNDLSTNDKNL